MLTRQGHRVTGVASGDDAVALARATAFDLVLMSVQMPGKDGVAATLQIQRVSA